MKLMQRMGCAASVVALALLATSVSVKAQTQGGPIKFGGLAFTTGKFSSYGKDIEKGMRLAVKQINDSGGLLGSKVEFDLQDTASESAQAVSLLRRFAGTNDVVGVVGPVGTPDFLAVLPLTGQLNVPVISLGSQKEMASNEFSDWIVRVNLPVTPGLIKDVIGQAKKAGRKIDTVALLRDRANDSAQAEARALRQALESGGGPKLVADEAYASGDKDFGALIDKMLREKPDAIWLAGTTNEVSLFLQQARARGFKGVILGGAGMNDPKIGQLAKDAAAGVITFLPVSFESSRPNVKKFVADYREAYGQGPIPTYAAYGYDGVMLLANAVKSAKATDRKKVMQALGTTKSFVGVSGSYSYAGKGDNVSPDPVVVEMTADGNFKPLN